MDIPKRFSEVFEKANKLFAENDDSAIGYLEKSLKIAQEENYEKGIFDSLKRISIFYLRKNNLEKSLKINLRILKLGEEFNNRPAILFACTTIGANYYRLGDMVNALTYLHKGAKFIDPNHPDKNDCAIYINFGIVHNYLNDLGKSFEFYQKALLIAEKNNNKDAILNIYLNLQGYYYKIADWDNMEIFVKKALALAKELNNDQKATNILNNLAVVYIQKKHYEDALEQLQTMVRSEIFTNFSASSKSNAFMNIGKCYIRLKEYKKAKENIDKSLEVIKDNSLKEKHIVCNLILHEYYFVQKLFDKDETLLLETLKMIEDSGNYSHKISTLSALAKLYQTTKKWEKATIFLEKSLDATDKYFSKNLADKLAEMQTKFDIERAHHQNEILTDKNNGLREINKNLNIAQDSIRELERENTIVAMAVTTSHEINQPLMIIKGNAEMMRMFSDNLEKKQLKWLTNIENGVDEISNILDKFLNNKNVRIEQYTQNTEMITFDD